MSVAEPDPNRATDREWFAATGACGGCGMGTCPCGGCDEPLCSRCPTRQAEGWFCTPDCRGGCAHNVPERERDYYP